MANFPAGPLNGETTTVNGIVYIYDGTKTAWKRSTSFAGNLTILGNITSANVITGNVYTSGGIYWSNNGAAYSGGGGGGSSDFLYTASATAPGSPTKGDQWFDTGDGTLYEYIDDGDSLQWVDIQTPTFASNAVVTSLSGDVSTSGNISASSIVITSGIYWANGVAFVSSVYSNVNVEAYLGANVTSYQTYANATFTSYSNTNVASYLSTTPVPFANSVSVTAVTNSQLYYVAFGNVTAGNTILHSGGSLTWNPSTQALVAAGSVQTSAITAAAGTASVFNSTATLLNIGGAAANVLIGTTSGTATNTVFGGTGVTGGQATGNIYAGNIHASSFRFANGVNILSTVSGGSGTYSNTNVIAYLTLGANIGSGTTTTNLVAAATTTSTSTTTGALVVRGGAGIAGNLYASGNIILASGTGSNVVVAGTTTSTSTTTGALVVRGGAGVAGNVNIGGNISGAGLTITGATSLSSGGISYLLERASVTATAPASSIDIDLINQSVYYWTANAANDSTANIRGNATTPLNSLMSVGQSVTVVLFFPNGPSNFYVSTVKVDNTTITPAYQGNTVPALGNSNSMDIYSFTLFKTASATFKVYASQTQFIHPG
jgi:hypothetical protein